MKMIITLHIRSFGENGCCDLFSPSPFGLMSAENMAPVWLYQPVPADGCVRAINEMCLAMLFVDRRRTGPFRGGNGVVICTRPAMAAICISTEKHQPDT